MRQHMTTVRRLFELKVQDLFDLAVIAHRTPSNESRVSDILRGLTFGELITQMRNYAPVHQTNSEYWKGKTIQNDNGDSISFYLRVKSLVNTMTPELITRIEQSLT